jgi:hypothetical protein
MRLLLNATFTAGLSIVPGAPALDRAEAAGCTGENCPPPAGQGRDCERERQEQTTS